MKKAAATVSFIASGLLFIVLFASLLGVWQTADKRLSGNQTKAEDDAILAGKEIVQPTDNSPDGSTLMVMGLSGAAFLVAGLALWPKAPAHTN